MSLNLNLALRCLAALTVVGLLAACGGGSGDKPKTSPSPTAAGEASQTPEGSLATTPEVPFGVWEALRDAVRKSPDHLPQEAERLVAEGDANAIFEFVRDDIVTYPPGPSGFEDAVTATTWGTSGALRGGAGTPREKADLLAELYQMAGFDTTVVMGSIDIPESQRHSILLREYSPVFEPAVGDATLDAWRTAMGHASASSNRETIDTDGAEAKALAGQLLASFPAPQSTPFRWGLLDKVPLVKVNVGGTQRYANPLVPGGEFGNSYTAAEPEIAPPATSPLSVTVSLEALYLGDAAPQMAVQGTWGLSDLVGRQVVLTFRPQDEPTENTVFGDLRTFTPSLRIHGSDLQAADLARLNVQGQQLALERATGQPLAALRLKIAAGDVAVTRLLAASLDAGVPDAAEAVSDDVHAALFGTLLVSVEAAAPGVSQWIDDILTSKIATRAAIVPLSTDDDVIKDAARYSIPPEVFALQFKGTAPSEDSLTFETGPRVVVYGELPRFDRPGVRWVDLLPFAGWATVSEDPDGAFAINVEETVAAAVLERALFEESTASVLDGQDLLRIPPGELSTDDLPETFPESTSASWVRLLSEYAGYERIVPVNGDHLAFWAIDPNTGSVIGVLANSTGGGITNEEEFRAAVNDLYLDALLTGVGFLLPGYGLAASAFAALGQAISFQVNCAAIAISIAGTGATLPAECTAGRIPCVIQTIAEQALSKACAKEFRDWAEEFACDKLKGHVADKFGYVGKAYSTWEEWSERWNKIFDIIEYIENRDKGTVVTAPGYEPWKLKCSKAS